MSETNGATPAELQPPSGPPTVEEVVAAGFFDPDAPGADGLLEVVKHLIAAGVTLDEMRLAVANTGWIATALADRSLFWLGDRMTIEEASERSGVPVETLLRIRLAAGLPARESTKVPAWFLEDVDGYLAAAELFSEAATLAFTRVMGAAAAKMAEAEVALFLTEVDTALTESDASPMAWAEANEQAAALVSVSVSIFSHFLREHLTLAVPRQRSKTEVGKGAISQGTAIAFVDLVGSTAWAEQLPLREHTTALARFELFAWEAAIRRDGRVVKLIGDEAMIVAPDPVVACEIALEICDAVAGDSSLPPARGAVGYGPVAFRDGDYFGSLVNTVARAVKRAAPGAVAVTGDARDACLEISGDNGALAFRFLGDAELRGVEGTVPLYSVSSRPLSG